MTTIAEWLLDLENIRLGSDRPLTLKWDSPWAAWMLFAFGVLALTWILLTYRRERASAARRIALAAVRCTVVAAAVAAICRPALVLQRNRVERSHVAVLLDTSLSMATTEHYRDESLALSVARGAGLDGLDALGVRSRLELVAGALTRDGAAPLRNLLERNAVQVWAFAGEAEPRGFFDSSSQTGDLVATVNAARADGASTDIAMAIGDVIRKAQGRRLAAIVLASDGQATQPTSLKDALDLARDRQIPVLALRLGSPERPRDIEAGVPRSQETVFVNDVLAVEDQIVGRGLTDPLAVTVRLVDERDDVTVASQEVVLDPDGSPVSVELRTKPTKAGMARYRVEVPAVPGEISTANNAERVDVTVLDNRVRVLFVDGYPRYEYRYLKNALLREKTVDLSVLLLEADEQFVQEGTEPIRRFPETPEELSRYDVVLFGDVDPRTGWLTYAQMNMLLDFVGDEGGGFGLIAGERAAPHRFLNTPLERLIPVRIDPAFLGHYDMPLVTGFKARLTAEGCRSGILRFAADREENERLFHGLPELYWIARTLGPSPGASVLVEHPTTRSAAGQMPLVITGRYGAGKLFFQATDDTWHWRRHTGELVHDAYWVQVVRELMPAPRVAGSRRFILRTDRRVYPYGVAVQAQVEVLDSQLLSDQHETIQILAGDVNIAAGQPGDAGQTPDRVPGAEERGLVGAAGQFSVHRLTGESNLFEGTWVPPAPGTFVLEASDMGLRPGERAANVLVRVERPDLEARRPEADHDVLARIANATEGALVNLDELGAAFAAIRDRSVQIPDDLVEPLWDSKLALAFFALMISMEWILRKAFGLL